MAIALIVASGLFLAGCSNMSSAATVGGTDISMKMVEDSIAEILAERAKTDTSQMQLETGDALNRSQLQFFITNKIIEEVATTRMTERGGRADDKRSETAMEDRKIKGYF
mgnify:CR=1 FL=1